MWPSIPPFNRSASNLSASRRNRSSPRQASAGSTLTEVLRKNPFRASSRESLPEDDEDDGTQSLNEDLAVLANFFPDVKLEVLREILNRFDGGNSRLPICTEQLYKYKTEWARGRMTVPPRDQDEPIPVEERFRTNAYIEAVRYALGLEFRNLSKGAVDAVLAEVNFSYSNARPTLQGVANRSWRAAITNYFKKRKPQEDAPACLFERNRIDPANATLLPSGSKELDDELNLLYVRPLKETSRSDRSKTDLQMAKALNQRQAEEAQALFECQVCFTDITFEEMSTCTRNGHVICFDCLRRTLHEAVFGQGWAKSVESQTGTLHCLADEDCKGYVTQVQVKRAVLEEKSGSETWSKFDERLADDALLKSSLPLVRCPFCPYAEVDNLSHPEAAHKLSWHIRRPTAVSTFAFILILELVPAIIMMLLPLFVIFPGYLKSLFFTSLTHLAHFQQTSRFTCLNPACLRKSCLKCSKSWHDPHACHEPLILSLRTTVEAARTAAIKRTCPRCGTSFVKSSGCNKLTCVCGYAMCYLCRRNIGKTGESEGALGYRHFCEHFRPAPGQKCTECNKCDLYRAEDEDVMVRRAGEEAERAWREREGMVGVRGLDSATGNLAGEDTLWRRLLEGRWSVQEAVDWIVAMVIVVDLQ